MNSHSNPAFLLACILMLFTTGCQQRAASKLLGRWEGHPDSAVKRAAREAEKYGDDKPAAIQAAGEGKTDSDSPAMQVTDWENYELTIVMDFVSSSQLEMSFDGQLPRSGTWKILSTTPSGCTIEVETETDKSDGAGSSPDQSTADKPTSERRRFELLFDERDDICVGFQLTESGADAQVGALYFERPNSANAANSN